jgi:hypothetical protein
MEQASDRSRCFIRFSVADRRSVNRINVLRAMSTWLREILVSLTVAAITLLTFAIAVAVGVLVSIDIGGRNWLVGASVALGFLVCLAGPLLWVMKRMRRP